MKSTPSKRSALPPLPKPPPPSPPSGVPIFRRVSTPPSRQNAPRRPSLVVSAHLGRATTCRPPKVARDGARGHHGGIPVKWAMWGRGVSGGLTSDPQRNFQRIDSVARSCRSCEVVVGGVAPRERSRPYLSGRCGASSTEIGCSRGLQCASFDPPPSKNSAGACSSALGSCFEDLIEWWFSVPHTCVRAPWRLWCPRDHIPERGGPQSDLGRAGLASVWYAPPIVGTGRHGHHCIHLFDALSRTAVGATGRRARAVRLRSKKVHWPTAKKL